MGRRFGTQALGFDLTLVYLIWQKAWKGKQKPRNLQDISGLTTSLFFDKRRRPYWFAQSTRRDPHQAGAEGARLRSPRLKLSGKRTGALASPGKLRAAATDTEGVSP